jgi:hypothetical protein
MESLMARPYILYRTNTAALTLSLVFRFWQILFDKVTKHPFLLHRRRFHLSRLPCRITIKK